MHRGHDRTEDIHWHNNRHSDGWLWYRVSNSSVLYCTLKGTDQNMRVRCLDSVPKAPLVQSWKAISFFVQLDICQLGCQANGVWRSDSQANNSSDLKTHKQLPFTSNFLQASNCDNYKLYETLWNFREVTCGEKLLVNLYPDQVLYQQSSFLGYDSKECLLCLSLDHDGVWFLQVRWSRPGLSALAFISLATTSLQLLLLA